MKISKLAAFSASLVCFSSAFADTQDIKAANNQLSIQAVSTNVNYTETGDGRFHSSNGTLDTETGSVPGVAMTFSVMKNLILTNDYLQLHFSRNSGHTDYTGSLQSGGAFGSVVGQSGATMTDYSMRYGKGFAMSNNAMLTPYGELGYHKWQRDVNYGETYSNNYVGIGALAQFSPTARLVLSANALLGVTYDSNINIAGPTGFSGPLGNSSLYKLGLSADYAFTKSLHGNIGVDYTAFNYGASDNYLINNGRDVAWEPRSQSRLTTVSMGVGYAF